MRVCLSVLALIFGVNLVSLAQAQTTLDATKVTCDQFVHSKVGALRVTAAWLSGFYHGQRNNRTIDLQEFEDNLSKLERFCYQEKNFKIPVMQAIEQVLPAPK
jgi:acid stress chaperone HdeB